LKNEADAKQREKEWWGMIYWMSKVIWKC